MKKIWYLFLIISFFSCKEENKQQSPQATSSIALEAPLVLTPGKDTIKLPVVVSSSEVENPKVIQIPIKDGGFYTKKKKDGTEIKIDLKKAITAALDTLTPQGIAHFTNFTTNDGLALDGITCSTLDKTGNLWFGTWGGGVSRYDGKTFTNYTKAQGFANNSVWSITEDKTGNLWFGTDGGGVSRYDGKAFTNYTTAQGLANNVVRCITEDKTGNLWFGTDGGGLSRYNGKTFTNYTTAQGLANNIISSVIEDKTGNLWFGTDGGGVSRYDGKTFTNYTTAQGLANNSLLSIKEDKIGNLWFGTNGGGVSRFDGKTFVNYTTTQGLANNSILSITEDKTGNLWFGTWGGGVSRLALSGVEGYDGKMFTNYTTAQGLANNSVYSITEDKIGNLWFGTDGGGVSRYNGKAFSNYTKAQGLANNSVFSITEDKTENLWFGTYGDGVSRYDGKTFTNYTTAQGLANNVIRSITEDKIGNLWFGTDGGGVSRLALSGVEGYDGKTFTNYTTAQGLANNSVYSIIEDKTGNLWFGTYGGGVSRYDGKTFTNYTTAQGLANNLVRSIIEDKTGNLWFGTDGGGVSRYDGKTFTNYTTTQGLANNSILSITQDKFGNLWLATGGGVSRYDGKTFTNYTTTQGLPDNVVTQVVIDKNGKNLVIATNYGIALAFSFTLKPAMNEVEGLHYKKQVPFQNNLNNEELTRYYDLALETFNSATGYPVKDVNAGQNCLLQDNKGIYWAGTGSDATALVRIDFDAIKRNLKPPTPILYRIKLNEENVCYYTLSSSRGTKKSQESSDDRSNKSASNELYIDSATLAQQEIITYGKSLNVIERDSLQKQFADVEFDGITQFYPIPQNLVLPYEHNNVTFEFNAVQLSRAHLLNFQYMLEGYDKTWSPVLKKREATFGNINAGTYTFKLKAQYTGPDGNNAWSEVLTYTFKVLPPWYRTWWMYTIYFLCLMSFVFGLVSANSKRLRAKAIELQLKVDKATHEIKEQKHLVEEKQKEILDSINYAQRIQYSLLASKKLLDENLKDHFLFFKPKDVVSGDFYWGSKLSNGNFILVNADSTGHGVPGAIMSMLNISCLNEAINADKLTQPADILNATRKKIIEHLLNDGSADGGKDGMDCSLISFDFKNKKLLYAAANNPVWIIRDKIVIALEADRMPIGKHDKDSIPFTQHEFDLQAGDMVYTLTDGFPDQFGGPKGKKFMYKQLENLLISISHESMEIQKQKLENVFENWKGDLEQVDDVCVIGVRV